MFWNKQKRIRERSKLVVGRGSLETLVNEGAKKWLVWDTYVATTNMPEPEQQSLGVSLIRTYLKSLSKLSSAYLSLSELIHGHVDMQKVVGNEINPLGSIRDSPDTTLFLLGMQKGSDRNKVLQTGEIDEAMRDYYTTELAMANFAYQLAPQVIGKGPSQLVPKSIELPDSLFEW